MAGLAAELTVPESGPEPGLPCGLPLRDRPQESGGGGEGHA